MKRPGTCLSRYHTLMKAPPIVQSIRFGLGPRFGDRFGADMTGRLAADLDATPIAPSAPLANASDGLVALKTERALRRARRLGGDPAAPPSQNAVRDILLADRADTFTRGLSEPIGFRERLTIFWTNHFTVSVRQGPCRPLAGAFRREAIAPHVTGRFGDMLLAVMRHPAMLHYLENVGSVGPDSRAGQHSHRGLNENLARECLELHTLSPASGYTQADVTSFAAILTGWSVQEHDLPYGFIFRPNAHQPGPKALIGQTFPEGEQGGVEALAFLAAHPATHAHLARQLVTHFGADNPDPREIRLIEETLRNTGGDLHATSLALLRLASATRPGTKLRSPNDYLLGAFRALSLPPGPLPSGPDLAAYLGQPMFEAPLPNGWPDRGADWAGPLPILRRADAAAILAAHAPSGLDPLAVAHASLGPLLRPATAASINHASSRQEGLALLLASAEFQRR